MKPPSALVQKLGIILLCLGLQSCAPRPEKTGATNLYGGVAKSKHHNALMDAAFGAVEQKVLPQEVFWQAHLPLPKLQIAGRSRAQDAASGIEKNQLQKQHEENLAVLVRPREVIKLNDTQLALVIESFLASDLERISPAATVSSPSDVAKDASVSVWLGVVFFDQAVLSEREAKENPGMEAWQVSRVTPFFDAMLLDQNPPETQVYKLGSNNYLMTYVQQSCRQGICGRWLTGYLLRPEGMNEAINIRLSGDNVQSSPDCHARLQPYTLPAYAANGPAGPMDQAASATANGQIRSDTAASSSARRCYVIDGALYPISREVGVADVSIRFEGVVSEGTGQRRAITQNQLWRLQGNKLVQIEGEDNPVPSPDLLS